MLQKHPAVIGYQVDNETHHYGVQNDNVQRDFVSYIKIYNGDIERFNHDFGLDYWNNRIDAWEDFPSMKGVVNGSLATEFSFNTVWSQNFRSGRSILFINMHWITSLLQQILIMHGVVSRLGYRLLQIILQQENTLMMKLIIYHRSQDDLTGAEVSWGGDIIRSIKQKNYFVWKPGTDFKERVPFKRSARSVGIQPYSIWR